jgi:hypothetical protein
MLAAFFGPEETNAANTAHVTPEMTLKADVLDLASL